MSKEGRSLDGWNQENKPNKWALWAGLINEINWQAQIAETEGSNHADGTIG